MDTTPVFPRPWGERAHARRAAPSLQAAGTEDRVEPNRNRILLVDDRDRPLGFGDKLPVHEQAVLHRAFSIFVFDGKERLLLQLRSGKKEAFGGLWTNTCCRHHYE